MVALPPGREQRPNPVKLYLGLLGELSLLGAAAGLGVLAGLEVDELLAGVSDLVLEDPEELEESVLAALL